MRLLRFSVSPALLASALFGSALLATGCTAPISGSGGAAASTEAMNGQPGASPRAEPATSSMFLGIGHPPSALANDDTHVYWSELGSVFRASKTHPQAERLFGDGAGAASAIVVDRAHVYANDQQRGTLRAWSKKTGIVEDVLPASSDVSSIAQDTTNIYAGSWGHAAGRSGVAVISKTTHGVVATLRPGRRVAKLAVWGETLFTAELEDDDSGKARIVRSTTSGGSAMIVGHTDAPPYELVADGGEAYWIDARGLMSTTWATPIHEPPHGSFLSAGLSVVDGEAYVTEIEEAGTSDGKVLRVPVAGGEPVAVAVLSADAPAGARRAYGILQTFDRESFYVTTYWTSATGAERGDAIVKLPFPSKVF